MWRPRARRAPPPPPRRAKPAGSSLPARFARPRARRARKIRSLVDSLLLTAPALLVGFDEDVDLVGPLVALLVGHGERRGVLAHLLVGVHRVLIGDLWAPVAEVPAEGVGAPRLFLDPGGELDLQRWR